MDLKKLTIRRPIPSDASEITRIDTEGLATGHATFRDKPYDWDSFSASFLTNHGLALVVDDDNTIVAWAGVTTTSARVVYKGVGEVSIYVSKNRQGYGLFNSGPRRHSSLGLTSKKGDQNEGVSNSSDDD